MEMGKVRLLLVLICLCLWSGLVAQKKISGRSLPVRFSMMETAIKQGNTRKVLKDNYVFSLYPDNLDSLPVGRQVRPYSVAVVIGVEQYNFLPAAPYAAHDADLISRYFKVLLGVDKVVVHTNNEVTGFFFENLFNAEEGELARVIEKDKTDLYVYYSGHGISSADGTEMYMLPADCKKKLIGKQGYSLNTLFEELAKLPTRSTTVFVDACFSGSGKFSQSGSPLNLSGIKGVRVKPLLVQPWLQNTGFRVFTSSSANQPSLVLDEVQTGLFTYFLALGLKGAADLNEDGHLTANELHQYIDTKVVENSKKIYQEQTPEFYGNGSSFIY